MYFRLQDRDVFVTRREAGRGEPRFYCYTDVTETQKNTHLRIFGMYAVFSRKT